ncbi:MAG: hypothetical protein OEZ43_20555 [Gammaproteobacteria bacterium]|nr:hypothetical protein [Gammaproteobacteria bacterium]
MKKRLSSILFFTGLSAVIPLSAHAAMISVDCTNSPPGALATALASAGEGTTLVVSGVCNDALYINKNDITISGNNAVLSGFFPQDRIVIDGAHRVILSGLSIEKGVMGIHATNNASFQMSDVSLIGNVHGVVIDNGASGVFENNNHIARNFVFGLQVLNGSKLHITRSGDADSMVEISDNTLGGQISINSSLFVTENAKVNVHSNRTIGLSVNTGSTGMLFNASIHSHDNGRDGLDVVSNSNFEIDGDSEVISENNGREGISIDNAAMNLFGFFARESGFPRITARNNAGTGVLVESTSKLDIGQNASIRANNNVKAGVMLDDGSSAILQRSDINGNRGTVDPMNMHRHDEASEKVFNADVIVTFGSRITFRTDPDNGGTVAGNDIGKAFCDRTSLSRGDVRCRY